MDSLETCLNEMLDYCFHLPTLVILALFGLSLIWGLYDLNIDVGLSFVRLTTNQGSLGLFWQNGCCELR